MNTFSKSFKDAQKHPKTRSAKRGQSCSTYKSEHGKSTRVRLGCFHRTGLSLVLGGRFELSCLEVFETQSFPKGCDEKNSGKINFLLEEYKPSFEVISTSVFAGEYLETPAIRWTFPVGYLQPYSLGNRFESFTVVLDSDLLLKAIARWGRWQKVVSSSTCRSNRS